MPRVRHTQGSTPNSERKTPIAKPQRPASNSKYTTPSIQTPRLTFSWCCTCIGFVVVDVAVAVAIAIAIIISVVVIVVVALIVVVVVVMVTVQ